MPVFENLAGRYARGSTSWDVYNKAHSGADLVVDRKSVGPVIVWDPALTLVIATQPKVLRDLWGKPGAEGRGVLARPLYSLPRPEYVVGKTPAATPSSLDAFETSVRSLYEDVPELALDDQGRPQPATLRFAPEAEALFERYEREIALERQQLGTSIDADDDAAYLGWLSKLAGQTARIAAALHAAEHWCSGATRNMVIGYDTIANAIEVARYSHSHARAVFALMGELPDQRRAVSILGWISERTPDELERLTVRDVQRSRGKGTQVEDVRVALQLLEERGYLRVERTRSGAPGRPSERIRVHPTILRHAEGRPDRPDRNPRRSPRDVSVRHVGSHRPDPCPDHPDAESWKARDGLLSRLFTGRSAISNALRKA